jgi:hypothetical protein
MNFLFLLESNTVLLNTGYLLKEMGFREVLKLAIEATPDHFHIFWKQGLLIKLDTYMGSINSGSCYFNYRGPRDAINGSNGFIPTTEDNHAWYGDTDIREGLRHKLDTMSEAGEFLHPWMRQPFFWLLHYKDTKVEEYDYKAINAERIALLPKDVQKAISCTP